MYSERDSYAAQLNGTPWHPLMQRFNDPVLEREYRLSMGGETLYGVRLGAALAALLFGLYGVVDVLLGIERLAVTLATRAIIIAIALGIFALTFTRFFIRHRDRLLTFFCIAMTLSFAVVMTTVYEFVADRYYVGFILIVMATYLLLSISFVSASVVATINMALYLFTDTVFHGPPDIGTLINFVFLFSATLIAAVGSHALGRQRRLAWLVNRQLQRAHAESQYSALHDVLTGLPNRRLLMEKLAHAMARNERYDTGTAVIFIDLDGFKPINDRHGHEFGDRLLKRVGQRLQETVRATDTVARIGGDEFVVLLEDLAGPQTALPMLSRIKEAFAEPVDVDGIEADVSLSLGIALHPRDATDAGRLLNIADRKMYEMKRLRGRR